MRTYLNISRRTPLLDVNVVEPVKFSDTKAVTGDHTNIYLIGPPACHHNDVSVSVTEALTKNNMSAIKPPRMNPLTLKSRVGSQGSSIGKSTTPAKIADIREMEAQIPPATK